MRRLSALASAVAMMTGGFPGERLSTQEHIRRDRERHGPFLRLAKNGKRGKRRRRARRKAEALSS